jgi:hypothetical protein
MTLGQAGLFIESARSFRSCLKYQLDVPLGQRHQVRASISTAGTSRSPHLHPSVVVRA